MPKVLNKAQSLLKVSKKYRAENAAAEETTAQSKLPAILLKMDGIASLGGTYLWCSPTVEADIYVFSRTDAGEKALEGEGLRLEKSNGVTVIFWDHAEAPDEEAVEPEEEEVEPE